MRISPPAAVHHRRSGSRVFGVRWLIVGLLLISAGCHTALRRPPALCQRLEDHCGDAVDCVGRSTSISNQPLNHHVTRHFRSNPITRELGRCVATGGPHCFR